MQYKKGRKAHKKEKRRARKEEAHRTRGPTVKIGIDVAKRKHKAALYDPQMRPIGNIITVRNTRKDAEQLLSKVLDSARRMGVVPLWGMEATGNYHLPLLHYLVEHRQRVVVFNPYQVKKYKEVQLTHTDTDPQSAAIIGDMLDELCRKRSIRLKAKEVREIDPYLEQARYMARYRFSLARSARNMMRQIASTVDYIFPEFEQVFGKGYLSKKTARLALKRYPDPATLAKLDEAQIQELAIDLRRTSRGKFREDIAQNLLHQARNSFGVRCPQIVAPATRQIRVLLSELEFVESHIQMWDEEIARTMENFPYYRELRHLVGMSPTMAAAFVGEIGSVDSYADPDQIISLAGWDIRETRSGDTRQNKRRLNCRGRSALRNASYWLASMSIIQKEEGSEYYAKKRREGRTHKEALVALARNKLRQVFGIMKNSNYKPRSQESRDEREASQAPTQVTPPGLPR